jgi:hypothetical protein
LIGDCNLILLVITETVPTDDDADDPDTVTEADVGVVPDERRNDIVYPNQFAATGSVTDGVCAVDAVV